MAGKKPKKTDQELIAEGLAAYEAGQPKRSNPYGNPDSISSPQEDHHRAFMWNQGWGRGHVRDTGGKGVPVFTGVPLDCTPEMIDERELPDVHVRRRGAAPMPWSMDELIGSVWINLWTGHMAKVTEIVCNRWGQPEPSWNTHMDSDEVYVSISGPGVWLERFIVDNWIRFDTMEPALQELWKTKATRREFEEMQREKASAKRKGEPARPMPAIKKPEEPPSEQLSLF